MKMLKAPYLRVAFLDFEASGLSRDSWPIEIGLSSIDVNLEIVTYESLIKPAPDWSDSAWSSASAIVHNSSRNDLDTSPDPSLVATQFLETLGGRLTLSDAVPFERRWLDRLFAAAGLETYVKIEDFDAVTLNSFSSCALDVLYERLDHMKAPHRAGPDSARLAQAWLAGLKIDLSDGTH